VQAAQTELHAADADKGGFRTQTLAHVPTAITDTQDGIDDADKH
jgi:hypothetical protein